MANRRMFSLDVVDTDKFLDMPASSQNLYFHLGMRADDDGFVSSPRRITKLVNCATDDLNVLISRGFILDVGDGIIVVSHWRQNNYVPKDRYHPTIYQKEKALLTDDGGVYKLNTPCIQNVSKADTQDRREKGRGRKSNGAAMPPRAKRFTPPTLAEVQSYVAERHSPVDPQGFIDFYEAKGWMVGKTPMRSWQAACRNAEKWDRWEHDAKQSNPEQPAPQFDPATETWRR